ncbi:MAG: hypothetical protein UR51_C0008G0093 [Candidatus Moranbacteria bacterium GW2011_GWF1_34_10]|nr:MAG: hypothetical protein UR51_C0008G0093 [Candidatus Moranbacteria bacterium GW2011_GWF1_34_10]
MNYESRIMNYELYNFINFKNYVLFVNFLKSYYNGVVR